MSPTVCTPLALEPVRRMRGGTITLRVNDRLIAEVLRQKRRIAAARDDFRVEARR